MNILKKLRNKQCPERMLQLIGDEVNAMNKIVIIGDIHGRNIWERIIVNEEDFSLIVFLGDYFDSYNDMTSTEEYTNFMNILKYKDDNSDKVVLLTGNHDLHYIDGIRHYSRYSHETKKLLGNSISNLINENKLQATKLLANLLFVHAGITNTWLRDNRLKLDEAEINNFLKTNTAQFDFQKRSGIVDFLGEEVFQGPLWIRPLGAEKDLPFGVIQMVGHTQTNPAEDFALQKINVCDSLGWGKYYTLEKNEKSIWIFNLKSKI